MMPQVVRHDLDAWPVHAPACLGPATLVLADGRVFRGLGFGARATAVGEVVFNTAMSGYQEIVTDPSYTGQLVCLTVAEVGNVGVNVDDEESRGHGSAGLIVRSLAPAPSNYRATGDLPAYLAARGMPGITELDTRALTRHLRERGAMRVGISTTELDPTNLLAKVLEQPEMAGANLVADVTIGAENIVRPEGKPRHVVAAIDLGIKDMTPKRMAERGLEVHVLPASTTLADIQKIGADGVFFSNGPGDPSTADTEVALLRDVLDAGLPYFGICFGNQIFGRALGFGTYKLKYGHRGINQPVMDLTTRKVEITAHNHGFAVDAPRDETVDTRWGDVTVSHVCLNDDVIEGLELRGKDGRLRAFSVQYHPEAAAGPHDSAYLFDRFVEMLDAATDEKQGAL